MDPCVIARRWRRLFLMCSCIALWSCAGTKEGAYDAKEADALAANRIATARSHRCDPASAGVPPRALQPFANKWIKLQLPEDATRYAFESDDVFDSRPNWHGRNWEIHVVIGGANLLRYTVSDRLCNVSDGEIERNVFFGDWSGRYAAHAVLARQGAKENDMHVILSVALHPDGLSEEEALQIIANAQVDWEGKP